MGFTKPALWFSCQALCILELMRAKGGAADPLGVNYRGTEALGKA